MKELKVRLTLTDELLGSQPGNPEIHAEFIASKAPDAATREEEIAAIGVDAEMEKLVTVFHRHNGKPCLMDYQIRGFFKSAAQFYYKMTPSEVKAVCGIKLDKLSAFKKKIDGLVFVYGEDDGRFIPLTLPDGGEIGSCQRPLRGQGGQYEIVTLANSETAPAGTVVEFKVRVLSDSLTEYVEGWLNYGKYNGLGQWRNSGKGSFKWEKVGDWESISD